MPGQGTHAPLKAKAEDLPDQPGFPIVEIPKDPQQDNDKSDGNGVIIIPSPGMPQTATPPSGPHTAVQGIETDHQMEDNDMKIARTEPELLATPVPVPSFFPPSSPLRLTKRLLKSQTSMSTTSPNRACLLTKSQLTKRPRCHPKTSPTPTSRLPGRGVSTLVAGSVARSIILPQAQPLPERQEVLQRCGKVRDSQQCSAP
jgi:hypothetical protein